MRLPLALGVMLLLLTGLTGLTGGQARAAVESDLVLRGLAAYDNLEYEKSVDLLTRALRETLTREERVATFRTLAFAQIGLDQPAKARESFEQLLHVDPTIDLDRTVSPRIRAVFDEVRASLRERAPAEPAPPPPPTEVPATREPAPPVATPVAKTELPLETEPRLAKEGRPISIRAHLDGASRAVLFHRVRGEQAWSRVESTPSAGAVAMTIQGMAIRSPAVEYYLELLDEQGATVAAGGSATLPRSVEVSHVRPVWKSPVLWGVLGGALVAGAVIAGVVAGSAAASSHDPASVQIMPH